MCSLSLSVSLLVSSQIMFGGFLETVSLCYITMVMLTVVPITPNAIILVMCSLPMMSAIWEAIKSRSRWRTLTGTLDVIKFGFSATFAVIGIALLLYKVRSSKSAQWATFLNGAAYRAGYCGKRGHQFIIALS